MGKGVYLIKKHLTGFIWKLSNKTNIWSKTKCEKFQVTFEKVLQQGVEDGQKE